LLFSGDDVKKAVKVISGGEQGRMLFGKLMLLHSNVLIMDEPTNHLDMESIESLNSGLEKFPGTLVFVSHDREFVSSLSTRVFEVKGDGKVVDYLGGYEDYLASQGVCLTWIHRRCAALSRSVQRPKGARLSTMLCFQIVNFRLSLGMLLISKSSNSLIL
jgi:energy-coupling factor transporter ATP-binding protein EcfA2